MEVLKKLDLYNGTAEELVAAISKPMVAVLPERARNGLKTAALETGATNLNQWCDKYQGTDKTIEETYNCSDAVVSTMGKSVQEVTITRALTSRYLVPLVDISRCLRWVPITAKVCPFLFLQ